MKKREVIWLLIRIAGLVFLWQAVENVVGYIITYPFFANSLLMPRNFGVAFLILILKAVLYSALGWYCLVGGQFVFNLLNREPGGEDR
jgi:hypothetical protein